MIDTGHAKEMRSFRAEEIRVATESDGSRTLIGYAAVFNSPSEDLGGWIEYVDPHAFDRALKGNADVRCLVEHDPARIVGRTKSGTMTLQADSKGLRFLCKLPDTSIGRDLITSVERGDLDACSFGFIAVEQTWEDDPKSGKVTRTLHDVDLLDTSVVCYPAYPATSVSVRSLPESMPMEIRSMIEKRATDKPLTKKVDGEELTLDCFAYRGSETETSEWKLPIHFASVAKTISHIRLAVQLYGDTQMPDKAEAKKAWTRIKGAAAAHDIEISKDDERSIDKDSEQRALTEQCTCTCPQCMSGACGICSADPQCAGAERIKAEEAERSAWRTDMELRLRLVEA